MMLACNLRNLRVDKAAVSLLSNSEPPESDAAGTFDRFEGRSPNLTADSDVLFGEDLAVGNAWITAERQITQEDVGAFAQLTGDFTPLHGSGDSDSPFGKPIAHGLLGMSVLAGLGATQPNVSTLALVAIEDWQFLSPVFFGDVVQARNQIDDLQPHGRRAVKVRWTRQLLSTDGRILQQGTFVTLVAMRSRRKPR